MLKFKVIEELKPNTEILELLENCTYTIKEEIVMEAFEEKRNEILDKYDEKKIPRYQIQIKIILKK